MVDRSNAGPPLPPPELMSAVGQDPAGDLEFQYRFIGEDHKATLLEVLGTGWDWRGRRMLDFGCGSGRLLRQLLAEAEVAEIHGSDVSGEMVAWVRENLVPPLAGATANAPRPPLEYPDAHFDLVTAFSVFTHLAEGWSDWLLELRRVLKPDGLLIATFLDSSRARTLTRLPWDEERVGMSACGFADPEMSWPNVLHSQWWLREHWGRAFEVVELRPGGQVVGEAGRVAPTQGWAVLRPRPGALTPADLEREDPADDRYLASRRYQFELLRSEGEQLKAKHAELLDSASWRLTAPLRRAKTLLRRG